MLHFLSILYLCRFTSSLQCGSEELDKPREVETVDHKYKPIIHHVVPNLIQIEIMRSFPGVNKDTLLVDFLNNETYFKTLLDIQLKLCYFDMVGEHHKQFYRKRTKRDLFPKDFWVKDVHHGYYHYLKHLDPWRWYKEAYEWIEIKSSLPPLYYVAKYCPEEIRFLKAMNYTEDHYKYLTWPPGLDPLWTGDPNKTTNLFTLLTSSSSSESIDWQPYSGESTTTMAPGNKSFFDWL